MPRVAHFEIPADEPERAVKFYESVFGWTIEKWEGPADYWLVKTGEAPEVGINGGIEPRSGDDVTRNIVDVADLDEYVGKVEAAGGKVVKPKTPLPGVGWYAYCADTEGNVFGMMQEDAEAK